jgi:hypothetical protein
MNDQEMEITNFGRNGDSAVIPKYAKGFVPNFAMTVEDINKKRFGDLFNKDGSAKSAWMTKAMSDKSSPIGAALLAKKKTKQSIVDLSKKYGTLPTIIGATGKEKPLETTSEQAGTTYKMQFPVATVNKDELESVGKEFDKTYNYERFEKMAKRMAAEQARKYSEALGVKPASPKSAKSIKDPEGFKGGITAAVGSVFDAAMTAVIGPADAAKDGGDFDVRTTVGSEAHERLKRLFGSKVLPSSGKFKGLGDFKYDAQGSSVRGSMIKKLFNELSVSSTKGKASGFIPNFNSMNKGIPVSKIRAHFDPMGNPVAVTNTRDEPNGLKDAIGRERKGIGMAASGFVPNFAINTPTNKATQNLNKFSVSVSNATKTLAQHNAKIRGQQTGMSASQRNSRAAQLRAQRAGAGQQDSGGGVDGQAAFNKLFALQMALPMVIAGMESVAIANEKEVKSVQSKIEAAHKEIDASNKSTAQKMEEKSAISKMFNDELKQKQESANKFRDLADASQVAIQALMAFSALQMVGGGKVLGKVGGSFASVGKAVKPFGKGSIGRNMKAQRLLKQRAQQRALASGAGRAATAGRLAGFGSKALSVARFAGPVGAVIGAGTAGIQIGSAVGKKFVAPAIKNRFDKKIAREDAAASQEFERMRQERRAKSMTSAVSGVGSFGTLEGLMENAQATMGGSKETERLLAKIRQLEEAIQVGPMNDVTQNSEELANTIAYLKKGMQDGFEIDKLRSEIGSLNVSLSMARKKLSGQLQFGKDTAQTASDTLGFAAKIQGPDNVPAWVNRAMSAQQSIAGTTAARQDFFSLQKEFEAAIESESIKEGTEEYDEFYNRVKEAGREFRMATMDSAAQLRNQITATTKELGQVNRDLVAARKQASENRFNAAMSLKDKTFDVGVIKKNIDALANAKTDKESEAALSRLMSNRQEMEGKGQVALFDAAFKTLGEKLNMSMEQLDQKFLDIQVGKSVVGTDLSKDQLAEIKQKTIEGIQKQDKKIISDLENKKKELQTVLDQAEEDIKKFGKEFNAEGINAAAERIASSLKNVADGTEGAGKILNSLNSVNTNALNAIKESNKAVDTTMALIKAYKTEIAGLKLRVEQIERGQGS